MTIFMRHLSVIGVMVLLLGCDNQRDFANPNEIEDKLMGRSFVYISEGGKLIKIPKSCLKPGDFATYNNSSYRPGCVLDRLKAATRVQ